jgi:ribonuclease HI
MRRKLPSRAARPPRLFEEPEKPTDVVTAHVDGASRGNPGPAAYAAVLYRPDGAPLARVHKYIGRATNNVAEYYGLIAALDYAAAHGIARLRVRSDSELLVRQMQGRYKVKHADLRPLFERARQLAAGLAYFSIEHMPRDLNAEADALANAALDATSGGARAAAAAPKPGEPKPRRLRAHFWDGVLVPEEPLELADGDKVEITVRRLRED